MRPSKRSRQENRPSIGNLRRAEPLSLAPDPFNITSEVNFYFSVQRTRQYQIIGIQAPDIADLWVFRNDLRATARGGPVPWGTAARPAPGPALGQEGAPWARGPAHGQRSSQAAQEPGRRACGKVWADGGRGESIQRPPYGGRAWRHARPTASPAARVQPGRQSVARAVRLLRSLRQRGALPTHRAPYAATAARYP